MTPSKQIPLTGILPRASMTACGSVPPTFPQAPSKARQDVSARNGKVYPVRIIVSGRRTAIRIPPVFSQVQGPLSSFVIFLRSLFHVSTIAMEQIRYVRKIVGNK